MRFDVYRMANDKYPFAVEVQSDFMSDLESRIVIPLHRPANAARIISQLHPVVEIENERFVLATHALASVPKRSLNRPVTSLAPHQDEINRALDLLFTGF